MFQKQFSMPRKYIHIPLLAYHQIEFQLLHYGASIQYRLEEAEGQR